MNNKTTDPKVCFATNLKRYMEIYKVSRRKLSDDINIKYSTICEWLKGTMMPRADKMEIVASYFNTTSSRLLEDPNAEVLVHRYPIVTKIPDGYTLEQAADEFFSGWGVISHKKSIPDYYGLTITHECNPMQPRYAKGEPVSFTITNRIDEFDCDYVIRRDGHDAEIVRVYEDQNPPYPYVDENEEDGGPELIYYVMIPVYNEENNYEPYHTDSWSAEYKVIGKVDK